MERVAGHEASIRVSDAERDVVARSLTANAAEGRLSLDELEERLAAAYAAKTYGELEPLLADLPESKPPDRPSPPAAGGPEPRPGRRRHGLSAYALANVASWGIWGVTVVGHYHLYDRYNFSYDLYRLGNLEDLSLVVHVLVRCWPLWVTVPWGIVRHRARRRSQCPERLRTLHEPRRLAR
jgi:hypothetical protein